MAKFFFSLFFVVFLFFFGVRSSYAFFGTEEDNTDVYDQENEVPIASNVAYVVIDYNNGKVLSSFNETKKMYPASLTKIMTLFIAFDQIRNREISFDTKITVSKKAASQGPSKLGLPAGSTITVRDAILAIIVKSHNDMAFALAEAVAGSEKNFIKLMNKKALELGLTNTVFSTVNGFHRASQYTTALDMAKLSRALMISHNSFYSLFSIPYFRWKNTRYINTNHLLGDSRVDGIKTGYTRASGYNLISSAQQNNVRIVAVVMGFRSSSSRDSYMNKIINESFVHAKEERKASLKYINKPKEVGGDLLTINHDTYSLEQKYQDTEEYNENTENTAEVESNNSKLYNDEIDTNYSYNITKVSLFDSMKDSARIYIDPSVKYYPKAQKSNKFKIQVGAFSSYSVALKEANKVVKNKSVAKLLSKNKIIVDKQSSYYLARISGLDKNTANKVCTILKNKGSDCFVLTS